MSLSECYIKVATPKQYMENNFGAIIGLKMIINSGCYDDSIIILSRFPPEDLFLMMVESV